VPQRTSRSKQQGATTQGNVGAILSEEHSVKQSKTTRTEAVVDTCDPVSRRLAA
jgi:hypothetical protein